MDRAPRRERPSASSLVRLFEGPIDVRSVAFTGLLTLATVYTLYFARSFLLPVVLAILLSFLLAPVMRVLRRIHLPQPIAAALVMFTFVGATVYGIYALSGPASSWIASAPESLRKIDDKVRALRKPVQKMNQAAEQVQQMANVGSAAPDPMVQKVEIKEAGIAESVFSLTQGFLAGGMVVVILLYFLLASGDLFLRNFVPYVGPLVSMIVLTLVGIMTFDSIGRALLAPGIYFCIDAIEANLITPALLGRRLSLNPVVVFLAVTFWGWLWGIGGALLAVPMLATLKIFCDEIKPLGAVAEFLGP